jgi:hypothetical protein
VGGIAFPQKLAAKIPDKESNECIVEAFEGQPLPIKTSERKYWQPPRSY